MTSFVTADGREPSILFLDPPEHTRLRGLVSKAFTPRAVEQMAPRIEQIVKDLLDAVADGDGFDVIAAFAGPLPTIVIAEMLGVDPADRLDFKRWSDDGVMGFDPLLPAELRERVMSSSRELDAYFRRVISERRAAPHADLISSMITAEIDGVRMTDDELVTMCALLLAAGNVTTTDLIGNGTHALLRHPDQLAKLRAEPSLIQNAVEEMLRYDSPVTETGRIPLHDTTIGGCPISRGESLVPVLAAANHDPDIYAEPHRFDITRADVHHHSFGGGVHYCLGAPLARLEAQIGLNALVKRFPRLRLSDAPLEYRRIPGFRGLVRLEVLI
jgi:cytochrome P450